jgi:chromosome segregation ATPase
MKVVRSMIVMGFALLLIASRIAGQEDSAAVTKEDALSSTSAEVVTEQALEGAVEGHEDRKDADSAHSEDAIEPEEENETPEECDCEEAINSAVDELRGSLSRLEDDAEKTKQDRSRLQAENTELKAKEDRLESDLIAYQATTDHQADVISELKASLDLAETRIKELTAEVQELLERVAAFKPPFSIIVQIGMIFKRAFVEARGFIERKL